LPESTEIVQGQGNFLRHLPNSYEIELREDSPRLASLLMKSAIPPNETPENSANAVTPWQWNEYLRVLETSKDHQLMLKYHEVNLKRILNKSTTVPRDVQDRIRRLLEKH
jgi:hypothetical protein